MKWKLHCLARFCGSAWVMIVALAMFTSICLTTVAYSQPAENPISEAEAIHNFCVAPLGPVSDKIEVELRLAVWNDSEESRDFEVALFLDEVSESGAIHCETVAMGPGGSRLVSHWWATAGHLGVRELLYEVRHGGEVVDSGAWELEILPSETSALPWAQGMWFDPGGLLGTVYRQNRPATEQDVREAVDDMHKIGINLVMISYVEGTIFGWGAFYPSDIAELGPRALDFDMVGVMLDQAARNGQQVILGIGRGTDKGYFGGDGYKDPVRLKASLDIARRVSRELWDLYAHHSSLYGWYLCHEVADFAGMAVFFDPISDFLHGLAPNKVVLVGATGTPLVDPVTLAAAHFDVVIYQDAVGPGYVPGLPEYTWDPELRIAMLDDVCESFRAAHQGTRKHAWANVESWEMAGPRYTNGFAAHFSRVKRQLDIEKHYFDFITMYEFLGTMDPPGVQIALGSRGERSERLYQEYKAYYEAEIGKARKRAEGQ